MFVPSGSMVIGNTLIHRAVSDNPDSIVYEIRTGQPNGVPSAKRFFEFHFVSEPTLRHTARQASYFVAIQL